MDAATKVQITGLLFTLVLPVGTAAAVLFVAQRWLTGLAPAVRAGLAVLAGVLVAVLGAGAPGIPPKDADDWLFYGPLIAGALGIALEGPLRKVPGGRVAVPLLILPLLGWQIAGRVGSVWADGVALPLMTSAWVLDALAVGLLVWLVVDRALDTETPEGVSATPLVLGPLALALIGAAVTIGLTGSARIGQLIGGGAAVIGVIGLAGWKWPAIVPSRGALYAGLSLLVGGLLVGHFLVEVPRPVATLVLLAPLGIVAAVAVARQTGKTLLGVVAGMALTGLLVGIALKGTLVNEDAKAAAAAKTNESGDADGTYYPY